MSRSAPGSDRRPYRWVSLVLVCVLALTIGGHLSPIIAGPPDALVVGMPPQAGDTNPAGPFDLHGLDALLHVTAVVESPFNGTELVPRGSDQRGGEFLAGGLGDGALDTLDPISEAFPAELTDDNGNPIVTEGLWALRREGEGDAGNGHLVAGIAGPGHYDDTDWFDSLTLVLVGTGAGLTLFSLGWSRFHTRRRHRSRPSHRRPYRSRSRSGTLQRH